MFCLPKVQLQFFFCERRNRLVMYMCGQKPSMQLNPLIVSEHLSNLNICFLLKRRSEHFIDTSRAFCSEMYGVR